jgi:GT2 family glycosyltransferase
MLKKQDIVVVAVLYNTFPEAVRYIESLAKTGKGRIQLILVDNSDLPAPGSFTRLLQQFDFIEYLKTGSNPGYFHGARYGLDHYLDLFKEYPAWTFVTNVDIVFEEDRILDVLSRFEKWPDLGVIAPAIISHRWKTDYNPERIHRYSGARIRFYQAVCSHYLINNAYTLLSYFSHFLRGLVTPQRVAKPGDVPDQQVKKIYAPHGACILFHRNYFIRGGTLDHFSFLFGEEIFVAETAMKLGLEVLYVPGIRLTNFEHASVGHLVTPRLNRYHRDALKAVRQLYYG